MVDQITGVREPLSARFLDGVGAFRGFGTATRCYVADGIRYFENEFWTSAQRRGHPLHEVSYRACFKPQLPAFFIDRLTAPGDTVLDPFMGRGTTLLEAALRGRRPAGNDINPIGTMLVGPRLEPPAQDEVETRLAAIDWNGGEIEQEELLAFYHPKTLCSLQALRSWLLDRQASGVLDRVDGWIRMVALNRLTGHSPGFFSGYTLPPNQAVSVQSQLRINRRLGLQPPERDVQALLMRKTRSLLRAGPPCVHPPALLGTGPAADMSWLPESSMDLVVTSPPFLDVVDYASDNWLRCWFAGVDMSGVSISSHRAEEDWTEMVHDALLELARVTRPGGHVAFEVGEVQSSRSRNRGGKPQTPGRDRHGQRVPATVLAADAAAAGIPAPANQEKVLLEKLVWKAAENLPFCRLGVMVNIQAFKKTANIWGVSNGTLGTNTNRIVLLQRA